MNFGEMTEEERWDLIIYKTKNSLTNKITYYDKPINGEYINDEPIILSDSEKKRIEIETKMFHSINKYIDKELEYSNKIRDASYHIIYEIELFVKKLEKEPTHIKGISQKRGRFKIKLLDKKFTVNILYYNFFYKEYYYNNINNIDIVNGFTANSISITIIAISGTIDQRILNDTVCYEMKNLFRKPTNNKYFINKKIYNYAINNKKSDNIFSKTIGEIICLINIFKQDGYIDNLYELLIENNDSITYLVRHSDVYKNLLDLQKSYNFLLSSNKKDENFKTSILNYNQFGYDFNRFIREVEKIIKYIKLEIGKIIIKSRDNRNKKEFFLVHYHYFMGDDKNSYYNDYHLNKFSVYEQ